MVPQLFCRAGHDALPGAVRRPRHPLRGQPADVMALAADKARAKAVVAAAGVARARRGGAARTATRRRSRRRSSSSPSTPTTRSASSLVREPSDYERGAAGRPSRTPTRRWSRPTSRSAARCAAASSIATASSSASRSRSTPSTTSAATRTSSRRDGADGLRLVAKEPAKAWIVDPADPITEAVQDAARRCHLALGCRHYSLFDFRIDPAGRPWFLEAGLYCSFSRPQRHRDDGRGRRDRHPGALRHSPLARQR